MASRRRDLDGALDRGRGGELNRLARFWAACLLAPALAGAEGLAVEWDRFVDEARLEEVTRSYSVLGELDPEGSGPNAERCAAHEGLLGEARRINPFSPALQALAVDCARLAGREALLAAERARMEALVSFLMADGRGSVPWRPILVPAEIDSAALLAAAGYDGLYGRYVVGAADGGLPFIVFARRPDSLREERIHFDFVGLWQRLERKAPEVRFPAYRIGMVDHYLEGAAAVGNGEAELAQITRMLGRKELSLAEAVTRIEALALAGSATAAFELLPLCLVDAIDADCAQNALGLLRPWAERGHAEAMVVLAYAAWRRIDGAGGRFAMRQWLDRARERLPEGEADLAFAELSLGQERRPRLSGEPVEALRRAVQAGDPSAALVLAQLIRSGRVRARHGESGDRLVRRAARDGFPDAQAQLGLELLRAQRYAEAWPVAEQAAAAQHGAALALLAVGHDSGKVGLPKDPIRALDLYQRAADRGNAGAMRRLGRARLRGELGLTIDLREAEGWLLSGALFGSQRAAVELAEVYLEDRSGGLLGGPADGYAMLANLADDGLLRARLQMAIALLEGKGVAANPRAALDLLQRLEDEGVGAAAFRLGQIHEFGLGGVASDIARARGHYEKGAAAGDLDAIDFLARARYSGRGGPREAAAAIEGWSQAAEAGHAAAGNNLAWVRCSSRDPAIRDPVAGTRLITRVLERGSGANLDDTLAACLAASGQFEQAIARQRQAIAGTDESLDEASRAAMAERLATYERGEAWFED